MFLRISSVLVGACTIVGCHSAPDTAQAIKAGEPIECAVAGAAFAPACASEREPHALILRHPDGGFRRLDVATDRTLTAADGSDVAVGRTLPDGRLEIAIGGDRYRLLPSR